MKQSDSHENRRSEKIIKKQLLDTNDRVIIIIKYKGVIPGEVESRAQAHIPSSRTFRITETLLTQLPRVKFFGSTLSMGVARLLREKINEKGKRTEAKPQKVKI